MSTARRRARAASAARTAVRSVVQSLEPRRLLAAVSWDGGGDGVNWTSVNNWSTNALPTPADDVTINIAANPTINLAGANADIRSLTTAETLNLNSGTLSLATASSASSAVTLSGATLTGAGTFTLSGGLTWSGGTMRGSGRTVVAAGTTSTLVAGGYALGRTLEVAGTFAFTAGSGNPLPFGVSGSELGAIDVVAGGTLDFTSSGRLTDNGFGATPGVTVRAGATLRKSAGANDATIGVPVNLLGSTVGATAGTLSLNGGGTSTGATLATTSPGVVQFGGGTHLFTGTFAGTGTGVTRISGGTVVADGAATLQNAELAGGAVAGAGTLTVNNLTWSGGTMRGSGRTVVAAGTTSTLVDGGYALGRTLEVAGTFAVAAGSGNPLPFGVSGTEFGTIDVVSGGTLDFTSSGRLTDNGFGPAAVVVRSGGTLTKSGTGTSPSISVPLSILGGTVQATGGTLSLSTAITANGGTLAGVGAGLVRIAGGTLDAAGTLLFQNGELAGGAVIGTGTLTVSGLTWSGGTMRGSGRTVVAAGTTSTLVAGGYALGRTLEVAGTFAFTAGSGNPLPFGVSGSELGAIDVVAGGTLDFTSSGRLTDNGFGATPGVTVRAGATLRKSAGANDATIGVPVNLLGSTVGATAGTLSLNGGGTSTGATLATTSPGVVQFGGGTHLFTGTFAGTGTGVTRISGGTVVADGAATLQNAELAGGAVAGAGTLTVNNLTWSGGTMRGSGRTVVAAGTTSTLVDGGYALGRTLEVAGTFAVAAGSGNPLPFGVSGTEFGTIDVVSGGTLDFTSSGRLTDNGFGPAAVVVRSGGTLTKSGTGTSPSISVPLSILGGTVQATGGTLSLSTAITANGGTLAGVGAGLVRIAGGTLDAAGTLLFQNGELAGGAVIGTGTLTVSGLTWSGGTMRGSGRTVVAAGTTSTLVAGGYALGRTLEVAGTFAFTAGSGNPLPFGVSGSELGAIDVVAGGTLDFTSSGRLTDNGFGATPGVTVRAGATLRKSAGANDATIGVPFTNAGTVQTLAGSLSFTSTTTIAAGPFLSAGRYLVASGATLNFSQPVTTLAAELDLTGTATVTGLSTLAVNRGRIGLNAGADFSTTPAGGTFTQEGILDLSPGSVFAVTGNMRLGGTSQPIIRTEIASATNFGRVTVSGTLDLNSPLSTSRFDPDLVGGYDPAIGTAHNAIVANGGIANSFDSFQGGLTPSGNVLLASRPNTTTLAVNVGPGPLPPAPQILSQAFEFQTRQAVVFQFDQDVSAFLGRKDYAIVNLTTGQTLPQTAGVLSFNLASNTATLVLTGDLPDGNYRLTVNASDIANGAGVPASGSPIVLDFFVLAGDADRDRDVDFNDLLTIAANYGLSGRNFSQGNFDYSADGTVGFNDLLLLASRYGRTLPALVAAGPSPRGGPSDRVATDIFADEGIA